MSRLPFLSALVGVVLLAVGLLLAADGVGQQRAQRAELVRDAATEASAFAAYLDRARGLDLLLAQNPALRADLRQPEAHAAADRALAYLEVLYPDSIGEACVIDEHGRELARVVNGRPAAGPDLSDHEEANPFFAPTLARRPGEVYQAPPYVSPDTETWVISNSTWVSAPGGGRLIVHFEVTLDSFRPLVQAAGAGQHAAIVEAGTGRLLLRTGQPLPAADEGFSRTGWAADVASGGARDASLDVDGAPAGLARIDRSVGGAPDWYAVQWATRSASSVPPLAGSATAVLGALLVLMALWQFRRQQATLRRAALLDHLTGLPNRKALEESLQSALTASTSPEQDRVAVLLLDLDGFKQINDSLGHDRGDLVLQEVGRRLHANILEHDTAARLGGDEFAIVLSRLSDAAEVLTVANRIREALTRPIEIEGAPRYVGVSIGAALYPDHGGTGVELLRAADAAMYHTKRERGGVRLYDPGTPAGADSSQLAAALLVAIETEQITLAFQPQFPASGDHIVAVEALARWHPAGQVPVPPGQFVPLAEDAGLIRALTSLTLRLALDAARDWYDDGVGAPVSVNLSGLLLGDLTLIPEVLTLLEERRLAPTALRLEVTETALIADGTAAVGVLTALRNAGVRIELDDFGSGYASFKAMQELPLDAVKIDRALLAYAEEHNALLLAATIELAHALALDVVCEGVEDEPTRQLVARLGGDFVQGYHLARPMSGEEIRAMLARTSAAPAGRLRQ